MTAIVVLLPGPHGAAVAAELRARGALVEVHAEPRTPALHGVDLVVVPADPRALTPALVAAADRAGARLVPVGTDAVARRLVLALGLGEPLPSAGSARRLADRILRWQPRTADVPTAEPTTIAVWGGHGAPGRTTLAIELALELARTHGHTALVDADAHAPAVALALGLPDEGPGLAAACRQVGLGGLDAAELGRISVPLGMPGRDVDVLTGINRPGRWPELSAGRLNGALAACRDWAEVTVVDVAASLETDEEIVSDLADGPRRNAATLAALAAADRVVSVLTGDPVGVARFVRAYGALRAVTAAEPVVVVNRLRPGAVGVDPRGQIRRALERYTGVADVWFLPEDTRAVDAARLAARPVAEAAPRSALVAGVRRLAAEGVLPEPRSDPQRPPAGHAAGAAPGWRRRLRGAAGARRAVP